MEGRRANPPGAPLVVVVGDLLYDLLAKVEASVAFGTDTFAPIRVAAGGSGANAAAWLASSGVETHFVGRVGDDVFGGFLEEEWSGLALRRTWRATLSWRRARSSCSWTAPGSGP